MKKERLTRLLWVGAVVMALALAGCGGGDDSDENGSTDHGSNTNEDGPPSPVVADAREIYTLEQSELIQGRDGGDSRVAWGHSIWAYGDTVLNIADAQGGNWHNNSFSYTEDFNASDGIKGFIERLDSAGAPVEFVKNDAEEQEYNALHGPEECEEEPCHSRWVIWPGAPVYDEKRGRALIFYGLFNDYFQSGISIAFWEDFDSDPFREIDSSGETTLLFPDPEPEWTLGPQIIDDRIYVFACVKDGWDRLCKLGRGELGDPLNREAWEFWAGEEWSRDMDDAATLFNGAPIIEVSYNRYFKKWLTVYSRPFENEIMARTAPELTGPWSSESVIYTVEGEDAPYDALQHAEYEEEEGRVQYVTYSRPAGESMFGRELAVLRIEFE